jgi:hypothetical protein
VLRDDLLVRWLRQALDALLKAAGYLDRNELERAEEEVNEALRRLAKLPRDTVTQLDLPTLLPAIGGGDPRAARLVARALLVVGRIEVRRGHGDEARAAFRRAMELYRAVGLGDDPADRETALMLAKEARQ